MVLLSGCGLFSGDVPPPAEGDDALFAGDPVPYSVTFRVVHPKPPQGEGQSSGNLSGEKKTDEANREKVPHPEQEKHSIPILPLFRRMISPAFQTMKFSR